MQRALLSGERQLGTGPLAVVVALALAGSLAGCMTIASRREQSPDWDTTIYGGVALDAEGIGRAFRSDASGLMFLILPVFVIDLPLSFVADTVLLPKTIPEQFGNQRKEVKAFVAAIEAGDLAGAQAVARRTPAVLRARVSERNTPLHLAVVKGQPDLVEWLAKDQATQSSANAKGVTPLGLVIEASRADLARILLDAGADANRASDGETPLLRAARLDGTELCELLLDHGALVNASGRWKETALQVAAALDHEPTAALLIARGADVNARDEFGRTPLHEAAWGGYLEVARVLLAHGADVDARIDAPTGSPPGTKGDGITPLGAALERKQAATAELLRAAGGTE